jgi:hypothetical protein
MDAASSTASVLHVHTAAAAMLGAGRRVLPWCACGWRRWCVCAPARAQVDKLLAAKLEDPGLNLAGHRAVDALLTLLSTDGH